MSATVEAAPAKDTTGPTRPPGTGYLSRVPEGFAAFFGALGLLCVLLALIPPLRTLLRPAVRFLDQLVVPVSANLAYAVFPFLLAAATAARKKIAWWLVVVYLVLLVLADALGVAVGLYGDSIPSLIVCVLAPALLIVARKEFYAASRRAAVRRALAVLFAGPALGILAGWGLVELFPGTLPHGRRLAWAADRVLRRPGLRRLLRRPPAPRPVLPARPVRRPRPAQRLGHALPLTAHGGRPARRRGGPHPRPPRALRRPGLPRLLRHPPRQGRRLLTQRQGRRHLPRRGRRLPRRRRPGGRPGSLAAGQQVSVAGRIMRVRDFGGIVFVMLRDWSGDHQLALTHDGVDRFRPDTDIGDHITATGAAGVSDKGEPTVPVTAWQLLAKCLRPLPDKRRGLRACVTSPAGRPPPGTHARRVAETPTWLLPHSRLRSSGGTPMTTCADPAGDVTQALSDPEAKVRMRYLDLVASPDARDVVRARSTAVQALRQGLLERGYLEVETPMLQQIHGGANARPRPLTSSVPTRLVLIA